MALNALVYDLEIIKCIPDKNPQEADLCYCKGWNDHSDMGISVVGVYDYNTDSYRVFCEDNLAEFFELMSATEFLIGFNNIGFDNKVLSSKGTLPEGKYYDLLQELYLAAGRRFKGSGLNPLCEANKIGVKSGNGALAPVLWQRGKIGSVIDYCLHDVKLTKELFELSQKKALSTPVGFLRLRELK